MTDTDLLGPGSGDEVHEEACGTPHPYAGRACTRPAGHAGGHGNEDQAWLRDTPEPDDCETLAEQVSDWLSDSPAAQHGIDSTGEGHSSLMVQNDERAWDALARHLADRMTAAGFRRHPEPVKSSREDVACALWRQAVRDNAMHDESVVPWEEIPTETREWWCVYVDAVLALWPGRSAAEVKAEAWDEGEEAGRHNERCIVDLDETTNPYRIERGES